MRSLLPLTTVGAVVAATAAVVVVTTPSAHALPAETAFALRGTQLLSFDPASPADVTSVAITGVSAGETLVGIDVRPQNGQLYTLGVDPSTDTATLYHLSEQTAFAAPVGTPGSIAFTSDGTAEVELPDPATVGYGFDVNPAVDRVRVTGGSVNFRLNPNTGGAVDGDLGGAAGSVTGVNPDGSTNTATTTVDGSAYTDSVPDNGARTTLYTLDSVTNGLYVQNPPNAGTQTLVKYLTQNGAALDFTAVGGFDLDPAVSAPANNAQVTTGSGVAALTVGGRTNLYVVDLTTGAVSLLGPVGDGSPVQGLALQRDYDDAGQPAVGLDAAGTHLVRFRTAAPGTSSTTAISGITAGESLVGIAWRQQTGQLMGLGVNPVLNTGTVYLIDPQLGSATVVGSASGVSWTSDGVLPVDLPDPAVTPYGLDFNPTVDRIRVVAGTFNARVNPVTGTGVDGDNGGAAGSVTGTNPDGAATAPLSATSYTNPWGRALPVAPATPGPTTQYALDAAADQLVVVNPPNAGTVTLARPVTLDGTPLDFAAPAAFDISSPIQVQTSGTNAAGFAVAVLTVGGTTSTYLINLTSGAAVRGATAPALRSLALGEAQLDRPDVAPPPPTPPAPVTAAAIKTVAPVKQQKRQVDTGRVLVCPKAFARSTCQAKLVMRAGGLGKGRVLGTSTLTVRKGTQGRLKISVTRKAARRISGRGRFSVTIGVTGPTGPQGTVRTIKFVVSLRTNRLF